MRKNKLFILLSAILCAATIIPSSNFTVNAESLGASHTVTVKLDEEVSNCGKLMRIENRPEEGYVTQKTITYYEGNINANGKILNSAEQIAAGLKEIFNTRTPADTAGGNRSFYVLYDSPTFKGEKKFDYQNKASELRYEWAKSVAEDICANKSDATILFYATGCSEYSVTMTMEGCSSFNGAMTKSFNFIKGGNDETTATSIYKNIGDTMSTRDPKTTTLPKYQLEYDGQTYDWPSGNDFTVIKTIAEDICTKEQNARIKVTTSNCPVQRTITLNATGCGKFANGKDTISYDFTKHENDDTADKIAQWLGDTITARKVDEGATITLSYNNRTYAMNGDNFKNSVFAIAEDICTKNIDAAVTMAVSDCPVPRSVKISISGDCGSLADKAKEKTIDYTKVHGVDYSSNLANSIGAVIKAGTYPEGSTVKLVYNEPELDSNAIIKEYSSLKTDQDRSNVIEEIADVIYSSGENGSVQILVTDCPMPYTITFTDCYGKKTTQTVVINHNGYVDVTSPWGLKYRVTAEEDSRTITQTNCTVKHNITFVDCDGFKTVTEVERHVAKATVPVKSPWGKSYDVNGDMEITNKVCPVKFDITFKDCSGKTTTEHITLEVVEKDGEKVVETEKKVTSPWKKEYTVTKVDVINQDCPVKPKKETPKPPVYAVQFLDCSGKVIATEYAEAGQPVKRPAGFVYSEPSLDWVYQNMTVRPTSCSPVKNTANTNSLVASLSVMTVALCAVLFIKRKNKVK